MIELIRAIKVIGLRPMLRLSRAHRLAWKGIIGGYFATRTIQCLFNVGFLEEVQKKGAVNVAGFARANDLDVNILVALCDALTAQRILRKDGSSYSLDRDGRLLVEEGRGWFDLVYGYEEVFHFLEPLLRKDRVYASDVRRHADYVALGSGEIEASVYFPLAMSIIAKQGYSRVLDLGCGDGTFLRALCQSDAGVTAYGIDIAPEAVANGVERARDAGLQNRIHLFAEDISSLESAPETLRDVEVATTFFVLHELLYEGAERVVNFLQSYRRVFPGVPLIVFEVIRPTMEQMRKRPGMAIHYALYHDLTHQRMGTRDQWRDMFQEAGFSAIEERYLGYSRTAIYTLR